MRGGVMTIEYILNNVFSQKEIKWSCRDLNAKSMIAFNCCSPREDSYSIPIIDVQALTIKRNQLATLEKYETDEVHTACLIYSNKTEDVDKGMTVKEILLKLNEYDKNFELCAINKDFKEDDEDSLAFPIFEILDGTNDYGCERRNIREDYCGAITDFWA